VQSIDLYSTEAMTIKLVSELWKHNSVQLLLQLWEYY